MNTDAVLPTFEMVLDSRLHTLFLNHSEIYQPSYQLFTVCFFFHSHDFTVPHQSHFLLNHNLDFILFFPITKTFLHFSLQTLTTSQHEVILFSSTWLLFHKHSRVFTIIHKLILNRFHEFTRIFDFTLIFFNHTNLFAFFFTITFTTSHFSRSHTYDFTIFFTFTQVSIRNVGSIELDLSSDLFRINKKIILFYLVYWQFCWKNSSRITNPSARVHRSRLVFSISKIN